MRKKNLEVKSTGLRRRLRTCNQHFPGHHLRFDADQDSRGQRSLPWPPRAVFSDIRQEFEIIASSPLTDPGLVEAKLVKSDRPRTEIFYRMTKRKDPPSIPSLRPAARMQELELKLLIDGTTGEDIWTRALAARLASVHPRARQITSTYVDTPDHALRRQAMSLRLRSDGQRWLQTVKVRASLHGGMSNVMELETTAPDGRLDISAIPDEKLRDQIKNIVQGASLKPVCETLVKRTEGEVRSATGTRALLAVDVADIKAGKQSRTLYELELEHLEGPLHGLFDIAKALLPDGGARFSTLSKADRGYLLAATGEIEPEVVPRKSRAVAIRKSQSAAKVAQKVLRECAGQVADNINAVLQLSSTEGPHQLRIGLRRLRSSLQVFKGTTGSPTATHLAREAAWLGQEVGRLRDLDVIVHDLVLPAGIAQPGETGFAALASVLEENCRFIREELRSTLRSQKVHVFLFDLMCFIETGGWLMPENAGQPAKPAVAIRKTAGTALNKRWAKARKRARHLARLSIAERHELRKEIKKLRYAVEFLGPLYPDRKLKPFLKRLKKLQDVFGDMNDAAMVKTELLHGAMSGTDTTDIQRAIGWLIGASTARAELDLQHAQDLWKSLRNTPVFWR